MRSQMILEVVGPFEFGRTGGALEGSVGIVALRKHFRIGSGCPLRYLRRQRQGGRGRHRRRIDPLDHIRSASVVAVVDYASTAAAELRRRGPRRRLAAAFAPLRQRIDVVVGRVRVTFAVQSDRVHFGEVIVLVGMEEVVTGDGDMAADVVFGWGRVGAGAGRVRSAEMIVIVILFRLFALHLHPVAVGGGVGQDRHDVGESVDLGHGKVRRRRSPTGSRENFAHHLVKGGHDTTVEGEWEKAEKSAGQWWKEKMGGSTA